MANKFTAVIKGLIFGVIFLIIWQISKVSLGIWGAVIFFAIILLTVLLSATPTPPTPTPTPQTISKKTKIWNGIKIALLVIVIAVFIVVGYGPLFGFVKFDFGGGFVSKSETFSYELEGNITKEKGGADWKSFTAGKGGVRGKLINPVDMKSGDCVKINFYANKKNGGKIKLVFLPYEGSPSYNKGKEILIQEEKGYASLCYMVGTPDVGPPKDFTLEEIFGKSNVRAQAVAVVEIPEGVTATFLEFKKIS